MKKMKFILLLLLANIFTVSSYSQCSNCGTSSLDFSTGVDNIGNVLPAGSGEQNWITIQDMFASNPTTPSIPIVEFVNAPTPAPTLWSNLVNSNWITTQSAYNVFPPLVTQTGFCEFTYSFEVCESGLFQFSGTVHGDNEVDLFLGATNLLASTGSFYTPVSFNNSVYLTASSSPYLLRMTLRNKNCVNNLSCNVNGQITSIGEGSLKSKDCENTGSLFGRVYEDSPSPNGIIDAADDIINGSWYTPSNTVIAKNITTLISYTGSINNKGYYNFVNLPAGTYELDFTSIFGSGTTGIVPIIPVSGFKTINVLANTVTRYDALGRYMNPCGPGIFVPASLTPWEQVELIENGSPNQHIGFFDCNEGISHQLVVGNSYTFRFKYNYGCGLPSIVLDYFSSGTVSYITYPSFGGFYNITFTPGMADIGGHMFEVKSSCFEEECDICGIAFEVVESKPCKEPIARSSFRCIRGTRMVDSKFGPKEVIELCLLDELLIDGSASTCEEHYFIHLSEFDLGTWNNGPMLHQGWVSGQAPNNIKIKDYIPLGYQLIPGKIYKFSLGTDAPWNATEHYFTIVCCDEPCIELVYEDHNPGTINDEVPFGPEGDDEDPEEEGPVDEDVFIFPNPSSDYINFEFTENQLQEKISVKIINAHDEQEMFNGLIDGQNPIINISDWRNGIYLCKITIGKNTYTKKVIKN